MKAPPRSIPDAVRTVRRRLRAQGVAAVALAVLAVVPGALVAVWLAGPWATGGAGPLAVGTLVAVAAVTLTVTLARRWVRTVDEARVTGEAERVRGLPEGSLRGVLELGRGLPPGVSEALFRQTEARLEESVGGAGPGELSGSLGLAARRRWIGLLAVTLGLSVLAASAGFASPERARGSWAPLLRPVEHLRGPVFPALVVSPGDTSVARGGAVRVTVGAPLRGQVTVRWRSVGDTPRERSAPVVEGRATLAVGPVASTVTYWATAPDGAVSDSFRITPVDPLLISALSAELSYPAYTGRRPDVFSGTIPALRVPEGTTLRLAGEANGPLTGVRLVDGPRERPVPVGETAFRLEWVLRPEATGRWIWRLDGPAGAVGSGPEPLDITVVEDAPPRVRITVPGGDTTLPPSLRQNVVADAWDDHGVAGATLAFRRVDVRGGRGEATEVPIPVGGGERVTLRTVLDASALPLLPGDAVEYQVTVRDNGPAAQATRSAAYLLRVPDMAELRERARRTSEAALEAARELAKRSRALEASTRDLSRGAASRQASRSTAGGEAWRESTEPDPLGFLEATDGRSVLEEHEQVAAAVDALRARLDAVQRALAEAGLEHPELQRRLRELQALHEQLGGEEQRQGVDALRDALEDLDARALAAALERLAERQESLREQLEQSVEMMRRVAAEQEMNALAREAEEIASQQAALAEAMREESDEGSALEEESTAEPAGTQGTAPESPDAPERSGGPQQDAGLSESRPEQQEELEQRAEDLGKSLEALQQQLARMGEDQASSQTGSAREKGKSAQGSMRQAAEEARNQQGKEAAASAQRAASQMSDAARALDQGRGQMSDATRREAQEAVQRATQEALDLAQRQEALRQDMERAQERGGADGASKREMRSEQVTLQQGLEQLGRNLGEVGQRSALLSRQVGPSLERARLSMQQILEALQEGGALPVQQAERSVEALNQLAMSLLQNDAEMRQAQASGGVAEALRRLAELAQEQGSLNGQLGALAPLRLAEEAMTRQLDGAAERQRGIARRIGAVSGMLGGREDVLGQVDHLSAEALEIARELPGARLRPEVMARQERLFHRLLDAGRTLEREEYGDERMSTRGEAVSSPSAPLDPSLLDAGVLYPPPSAEQLRGVPPAYQRLILEYFDRLNRAGSETEGAGGEFGGGGSRSDTGMDA